MASDWYYKVQDVEAGPVTAGEIRKLATEGRLSSADFVRRGPAGGWTSAGMVKGLFDAPTISVPATVLPALQVGSAVQRNGSLPRIVTDASPRGGVSVHDCISSEEKKQRLSVNLVNGVVWILVAIFVLSSLGTLAIVILFGKLVAYLLSEFNVRRLQALGTAVSDRQFPEVHNALQQVCGHFGLQHIPRVIVLNESSTNAFAIKFARHRVIVLFSQIVEGILNEPAELRFLLGHEVAHTVLDHGFRGSFEIIKSAPYKAARELTCDNCGVSAAGAVEPAKTLLKRLGVGNVLYSHIEEESLIREADYIYSGFTGWLVKRKLNYPPLGKRLANVMAFAQNG